MRPLLLLLAAFISSGCAVRPALLPDELRYVAPTGSAAATIRGAQTDLSIIDDITAYIVAIDGKRVGSPREGWSDYLPIAPGLRTVNVMLQHGSFSAQADLPFTALQGRRYEIGYSSDMPANGWSSGSYCDFWIVESASKRRVSEIQRSTIVGPIKGKSVVPIFIPGG